MSMSKKDYETVVKSLAMSRVHKGVSEEAMEAVISDLVIHLKRDNARFQESAFRARYYDTVAGLKESAALRVSRR